MSGSFRASAGAVVLMLWACGCDDNSVDAYCEHICDCRAELGCNDGNCAVGPGPECQSVRPCLGTDCEMTCEESLGARTDECRGCVIDAPCNEAIDFEATASCRDVCSP